MQNLKRFHDSIKQNGYHIRNDKVTLQTSENKGSP